MSSTNWIEFFLMNPTGEMRPLKEPEVSEQTQRSDEQVFELTEQVVALTAALTELQALSRTGMPPHLVTNRDPPVEEDEQYIGAYIEVEEEKRLVNP